MTKHISDLLSGKLKLLGWSTAYQQALVNAPIAVHEQLRSIVAPYVRQNGEECVTASTEVTLVTANSSIEELMLYTKIINALKRNGIYTVGEVQLFSADDLQEKSMLGPTYIATIQRSLENVGLSLSTDNNESTKKRLVRVFGSVRKAPATTLVCLARLSVIQRSPTVSPSYENYRKLIGNACPGTIGDLTKMSRTKVKTKVARLGFFVYESNLDLLREQLRSLGLSLREENTRAL